MRRTSGPQNGANNFYIRKQIIYKNKSPNANKTKSRGKIAQQSTSSNVMVTRKTNSFSKLEPNQSSTFFTNATQSQKPKKSQPSSKRLKDLKKYQKQIMEVLHTSASIIQRQWRKYLIRKLRKSLQLQNKKRQSMKQIRLKQFDSISGRTSQNSQMYNNRKYYSVAESQKKKSNDNSFNRNVYSFGFGENRNKNNLSPVKNQEKKLQNCFIKNCQPTHNRTRSDQPIKLLNQRIKSITKIQEKSLQFAPNIINVSIKGQNSPQKKKKKSKSNKIIEQTKYQDHYIKNQKGALEQILKKTQQKLQQKKLKKILALQNSFSSNLMTFRSYQKNIQTVSEQYNKKLMILMNKKKLLVDKFNQFVEICQKNISQIKEEQDIMSDGKTQKKRNQNLNMIDTSFNDEMSGFNSRSIAFQQWDFQNQFSDKKILSQIYKEKDVQLVEQKQTTIIHQLMQESKKFIEPIPNSLKQSIFSNKQINQLPMVTPKKQQQQTLQKEQQKTIKYPNSQLIQLNPITIKTQQSSQKQQKNSFAAPQSIIVSETLKKIQKISSETGITIKVQQIKPKKFKEQQVEIQLKKFQPIIPTIDVVNNWLLEVSHFILDNFGGQFLRKLIHIDQPQSQELWKHCINKEPFIRQYTSINQKIFKQFQFFHIKTLITDYNVQNDKKQAYSALMYTFNQALYDSLNRMLLDQLIEGRNWLKVPWSKQFRVKKLVGPDHAKQALQKAINRVSNISDYNILPLNSQAIPGNQFQQSQHNLIFAQEVKQIPLFCEFQKGFLLYELSKMIEDQVLSQQMQIMNNFFH